MNRGEAFAVLVSNGVRQDALCARTGMTPGMVYTRIRKLEKLGLVRRSRMWRTYFITPVADASSIWNALQAKRKGHPKRKTVEEIIKIRKIIERDGYAISGNPEMKNVYTYIRKHGIFREARFETGTRAGIYGVAGLLREFTAKRVFYSDPERFAGILAEKLSLSPDMRRGLKHAYTSAFRSIFSADSEAFKKIRGFYTNPRVE